MSREQTKQDLSPDENYEYSEQQKKIIFEEIRCLREMMEGFDDGYGDSDEYILQSFGDWSSKVNSLYHSWFKLVDRGVQ